MTKILIPLLDEATDTLKIADGLRIAEDAYKISVPSDYDFSDEHWKFLPGSTVLVIKRKNERGEDLLVAQRLIAEAPMARVRPETVRIKTNKENGASCAVEALALGGDVYELLSIVGAECDANALGYPLGSVVHLEEFPPGPTTQPNPLAQALTVKNLLAPKALAPLRLYVRILWYLTSLLDAAQNEELFDELPEALCIYKAAAETFLSRWESHDFSASLRNPYLTPGRMELLERLLTELSAFRKAEHSDETQFTKLTDWHSVMALVKECLRSFPGHTHDGTQRT